jgi:hypothetical protein
MALSHFPPAKYNGPIFSVQCTSFDHDHLQFHWSTAHRQWLRHRGHLAGAFLETDCGHIYYSGWAGLVNHFAQALRAPTNFAPTTPARSQTTTDGSDFWMNRAEPYAVALNYATFFGGLPAMSNVDVANPRGSESRTATYQLVCADAAA